MIKKKVVKMNNGMIKLTLNDEINGKKIKDSVGEYENMIGDKIKSYIIGHLMNPSINDCRKRSTDIHISIYDNTICEDGLFGLLSELDSLVFESLMWKLIEEKLSEVINSYEIKIEINEFLHKKIYNQRPPYDRGYTMKHERKEVSQKITVSTACKLMSVNYIPNFEYNVSINSKYFIKTGCDLRKLGSVITDIIYDMLVEDDYGKKSKHEITYKIFHEYCKNNDFVKLLEHFDYKLSERRFMTIKENIYDFLMEKIGMMDIEGEEGGKIYTINSTYNDMYIDVIGTNIRGDVVYIIENTDTGIIKRWDKLRKIFPLPHYKFVQASSKPIKNLPDFVENWVFNEKTEEMDIIGKIATKPI